MLSTPVELFETGIYFSVLSQWNILIVVGLVNVILFTGLGFHVRFSPRNPRHSNPPCQCGVCVCVNVFVSVRVFVCAFLHVYMCVCSRALVGVCVFTALCFRR